MTEETRQKILAFVKSELGNDNTGHGLQHALRVERCAAQIQQAEGGDTRIITAAALLHDCADHKLFADTEKQCGKIASLLASLGYTGEETAGVLYIIRNISFNKGENRPLDTHEAMVVRDADRLDAIGAVGIVRTIEYGAAHGRQFFNASNPDDTDTTLAHFYEKLFKLKDLMHTATARRMAEDRDRFMRMFVEQFYSETGTGTGIS